MLRRWLAHSCHPEKITYIRLQETIKAFQNLNCRTANDAYNGSQSTFRSIVKERDNEAGETWLKMIIEDEMHHQQKVWMSRQEVLNSNTESPNALPL